MIIQTILKPNLKKVENAVIVSKIIFLLAKSHMHMHIFSMQIDCLKLLGRVDYTNLLPYVEG